MRIIDVLEYFGSSYFFEKNTKMAHQNINNWKKLGYIPITTQLKIEKLTSGKLKADLSHCNKDE